MFRGSRTSSECQIPLTQQKICVVGSAGVGKTTLRLAYLQGGVSHRDVAPPAHERLSVVGDRVAVIEILDASSQSALRALREDCLKSGEGYVLLFSVTDRNSFFEIGRYRDEILRHKESERVPMMLVGNKTDLERERAVSTSEALRLSQELGMPFAECSALTGAGVEEAFGTLLEQLKRDSDKRELRARKKCSVL